MQSLVCFGMGVPQCVHLGGVSGSGSLVGTLVSLFMRRFLPAGLLGAVWRLCLLVICGYSCVAISE